MADILSEICAVKRRYVADRKATVSEAELQRACAQTAPPRGFLHALKHKVENGKPGLIAEIKKASPSAGVIRADFDPAALARAYAAGGAACFSVLTDEPYFQGRDEYLQAARAASPLPALRKDFMLDPYQILESRAIGADAVLLIMAALSDTQAAELEAAAHALGMDALVEVHNAEELERALLHLKSPLLGINNRNLKTLSIDLATTENLAPRIPRGYTVVCESGIGSHAEVTRMRQAGVHCFLVGESLMKKPDVTTATRVLLEGA